MIDEPEIHFSPDSEYKGLKPSDLQQIADVLRDNLTQNMKSAGYPIVETPGPKVLLIRTAITNLYLKKKKRGFFSYTPFGAAAHAAKNALTETLKKVDIVEMNLEAELSDSATGDELAAMVISRKTAGEA